MKAVKLVALLLTLGLCGRGATEADDFRLTAFALTCFVPFTPGLHTRAVLIGKIKLAHRQARFTAQCFDDAATTGFPVIQQADGRVKSIDVSVVTTLEDASRQVLAENRCRAEVHNGFLTFRCTASEEVGGDVDILASIEPVP